MRIKYKIHQRSVVHLLVIAVMFFSVLTLSTMVLRSAVASAEEAAPATSGIPLNEGDTLPGGSKKNDCKHASTDLSAETCGIVKWLQAFINILSAAAGLIITIIIIVAGIQYSAAKDDPQAVAAAKGRITNAIIALAAFIFFYAFLQWVVPGGVL